ncbi:hypothetical protein [Acinetobacter pecorum]|uniref:Uncharacterized protein n=1 Tax=Acinetobacter pecorum TaxID=2762215 RepID=A0ABR8VU41_9GAMM|nr:hypothetical protein [Acinetobacter pecorum]MBD8008288.1 hypothetical protein [Acinetobacter pecorum]
MIEEMLAAQATIQAAEIQASATRCAAAIGGVAIAIGVIVSWYTTLHHQKVARLAETRKDVYLELVDAYSNLSKEFNLILVDVSGRWPALFESIVLFSKKIDKALFVCKSENKESLIVFSKLVMDKFESFTKDTDKIRDLEIDLTMINLEYNKIINQSDVDLKWLDKIEKCRSQLDQKREEVHEEKQRLQPITFNLIHTLNEKALTVTHLLRSELGAKNNPELDIATYAKYKEE